MVKKGRKYQKKIFVKRLQKISEMSSSSSTRCAACKSLRRRCSKDCVLAPYFPSNNPQRFACVHKIFGASNISKILQGLPANVRADAAECMSFEAKLRVQDPVYGCVGMISQLEHQITMTQQELANAQAQIALHSAEAALRQQGLMPKVQNQQSESELSLGFIGNYEGSFHPGTRTLQDRVINYNIQI